MSNEKEMRDGNGGAAFIEFRSTVGMPGGRIPMLAGALGRSEQPEKLQRSGQHHKIALADYNENIYPDLRE